MEFIQYKFPLKEGALFDCISDLMFEHGAISVDAVDAKDSPIFSTNENPHPIWNDIIINAIFDSEHFKLELIRNSLIGILKHMPIETITKFSEQNWHKKWLENTSVCEINNNLAIYPSHIKQPTSNQKIITLDPGLAFGTGTHPTTKMCLNWLSQNPIEDFQIIDYGCGSGILSIAAIAFNAKSVIAIDNDQQALNATTSNCKKNNIRPDKIKTILPEQLPDRKMDLIIANIYLNVLIDIREIIASHLRVNGKILLTGLLLEQKDKIMDRYDGFKFTEEHRVDDWLMLVAEKY
jgi:ribosomal protein L11 methyltransferase